MRNFLRDFKLFLNAIISWPLVILAYFFSLAGQTFGMYLTGLPIAKILTIDLLLTIVYLIGSFNIWDDGGKIRLGNFITMITAIFATYILLILLNYPMAYIIVFSIILWYLLSIIVTFLSIHWSN